jgi:hypothetical protein
LCGVWVGGKNTLGEGDVCYLIVRETNAMVGVRRAAVVRSACDHALIPRVGLATGYGYLPHLQHTQPVGCSAIELVWWLKRGEDLNAVW